MWERRYGFPDPERDAHGDRIYRPEQIQRLLLIKRLLQAGHLPGRVVKLSEDELKRLLQQSHPQPATDADTNVLDPSPWLTLLEQSQPRALHAALKKHLIRHGLVHAVTKLIAPLSYSVGEAWQRKQITVAQEHMFSEVVQKTLRQALSDLETVRMRHFEPPCVVLATLPNEQHAMGLLAAECFFSLEACDCIALGPNTPIEDIVKFAIDCHADIVALSISVYAPARETIRSLKTMQQKLPDQTQIWIGGGSSLLRSKNLPEGIQVFHGAQEITTRIADWRRHRTVQE